MLIDSNIVILSLLAAYGVLRRFIAQHQPVVSAVTYVEVLGFHSLAPQDKADLEEFFAATSILPVTDDVLDQAVALRQQRKMSLGDSLIAATCLVHDLTLVTHNTSDFTWINNLTVLDPLAPSPTT